MNLLISKKKFNSILLMLIILLCQIFIGLYGIKSNIDIDNILIMVSWATFIGFICEVLLWKYLTDELFCPYIVFICVLFIFCCGQSIGWTLGIDLGGQDLWFRHDYGMDHHWLIIALVYSTLGITVFHFSSVIFYNEKKMNIKKYSANQVLNVYKIIAKPLLIIVIPSFIANVTNTILAVAAGGYGAYYTSMESRSIIMSILSYLDDYYEPCLLLLLLAYRENQQHRNFIIVLMLLEAVSQLYIGGRSGAVMTVLGIMLALHYFIKPFKVKDIMKLGSLGYIGLALLNAIAETRNIIGRNFTDILTAIGSSFFSTVGHFVGELGWSMSSTVWTMMIVPSQYNFRYGTSYLASLLVPIPNLGFWKIHPAKIYANVGDWLEKVLNYDHGIGYSMTAESYINFGWFGLIIMFIFGMVLVKLLANTKRVDTEENILGATFQILIIMTIMKSLVRSSFSNSMRAIVYILIPLYLLIKHILNKEKI